MIDDSIVVDLSFVVSSLFTVVCLALVLTCILGIGLFYSGLTQRRSSLTMLTLPVITLVIVTIDWFIWGYSLCFGNLTNRFIGNFQFVVLRNVLGDQLVVDTTRGPILTINHFIFNGLFKTVCAALTFPSSIAERGRIIPMLVFFIPWCIIIYNPVNFWFWNSNGWLSVNLGKLPVLDFAGGNCVHVVSGFTTLAYSYALGPRNVKVLDDYRISSTTNVVIGTFLMYFGWLGFMAGSDFTFASRAIYIMVNLALCTSASAIVWASLDFYHSAIPLATEFGQPRKGRRHISVVSVTLGVMAGLVVFTPAGGYTSNNGQWWKSITIGVIGAVLSNLATRIKYYLQIDDAFDMFAIHGIGGIVGSILTGIFAGNGYQVRGGWVAGHWMQVPYQILGSVVVLMYVLVMCSVFLYMIDLIPGLHLRIDKNYNKRLREAREHSQTDEMEPGEVAEIAGADAYEFNGEFLADYMEFIRSLEPQDFLEQDECTHVSSARTTALPMSIDHSFKRG